MDTVDALILIQQVPPLRNEKPGSLFSCFKHAAQRFLAHGKRCCPPLKKYMPLETLASTPRCSMRTVSTKTPATPYQCQQCGGAAVALGRRMFLPTDRAVVAAVVEAGLATTVTGAEARRRASDLRMAGSSRASLRSSSRFVPSATRFLPLMSFCEFRVARNAGVTTGESNSVASRRG